METDSDGRSSQIPRGTNDLKIYLSPQKIAVSQRKWKEKIAGKAGLIPYLAAHQFKGLWKVLVKKEDGCMDEPKGWVSLDLCAFQLVEKNILSKHEAIGVNDAFTAKHTVQENEI